MFKIVSKSKLWKDIISMTTALVDEVRMGVNPNGISIKAVDPSHIAMLTLDVPKDSFSVYEADDTEIGVDLEKLKDAFKTMGSDVSMEYDEDKGRLVIRSDNITRRMATLDTGSTNSIKIPNINLTATIKLPTSEMGRSIVASTGVSDAVSFTAEGEGLVIKCGKDADDVVEMVLSKPTILDISVPEKVSTMIPLDFFTKVIKAIPMENVTLGLNTDYPIRISFDEKGIKGEYLIAPRIESE